MIGSHNSFTYLKSTNALYNRFPIAWRCQYKTIQEQYNDGVRFFDVRVKLEKKANRNMWRCAHGAVNLQQMFVSLKNIFIYFKQMLPGSYFRLILEDNKGIEEFKKEIQPFIDKPAKECLFICIKKDWEILYNNLPPVLNDYCYIPFVSNKSTWQNLKDMEWTTIKKYADKHNPPISKAMIEDPNVIYFMDYI